MTRRIWKDNAALRKSMGKYITTIDSVPFKSIKDAHSSANQWEKVGYKVWVVEYNENPKYMQYSVFRTFDKVK